METYFKLNQYLTRRRPAEEETPKIMNKFKVKEAII
jgi:hypothetical protein